jgi:hypothetical protein
MKYLLQIVHSSGKAVLLAENAARSEMWRIVLDGLLECWLLCEMSSCFIGGERRSHVATKVTFDFTAAVKQ